MNRLSIEALSWEKNTSNLIQFSEKEYFNKNSFIIQESMHIFKDISTNSVIICKADEEKSEYENDDNYKLLGNIIKEKDKYYFEPLLIDLGNDKENINDVAWLIYNKKINPEINKSYILKEGDIFKMGNVIFQVKMIQINDKDNDENEQNNFDSSHTLLISGSSNHSLILNKNYNNQNTDAMKIEIKKNSSACPVKKNNENPNSEGKNHKTEKEKLVIGQNLKSNKNKICRICYQEEDDTLLNPLIRPCKCSGSMKYIHLKCLLHWLKSRTSNNSSMVNNLNNNFNAYILNQRTECELCKQLIPDYIIHNDIKYCLIDFDYAQENKIKNDNKYNLNNNNNHEQNYANTNMEINNNNDNNDEENKNKNSEEKINFIVFDSIFTLSDNNKYRFITKFDKNNQMKIGRGLENHLVLNEITVSRYHCLLTLQRNAHGSLEIKFEDENSKFGSLVLIQKNRIEIIKGKPLQIQVNNVHLIIQYKKSSSLLSCCNAEVVEEKNTYEKMNYKAVKKKNIVNVLNEIDSDNEEENKNKEDKNENSNYMILLVKNKNKSKIENENMKTTSKLNHDKTNNIEEKEKNKDDNNDDDNDNKNEEVYVDDN